MPACSVVSQNGAYAVGTGLPRKVNAMQAKSQAQKPTIRSVFPDLGAPRRLELPLLSKTDFESAASTNSAIRACGGAV